MEIEQLADPPGQQFEEAFEAGLVFQLKEEADIPLDIGLVVVPPGAAGTDGLLVDAGQEAPVDPFSIGFRQRLSGDFQLGDGYLA